MIVLPAIPVHAASPSTIEVPASSPAVATVPSPAVATVPSPAVGTVPSPGQHSGEASAELSRPAPSLLAQEPAAEQPDSMFYGQLLIEDPNLEAHSLPGDSTVLVEVTAPGYSAKYGMKRPFNPEPNRAVWLSALFPGLGQVYNRSYWKLPIIVAGFMGLGYGTSWNNNQLRDYSQAYSDLLDADPGTKSYMNFFPPTTTEDSLDKAWLQNMLRSRKNFYRRNRDLCIICIVAVYLLCMVDAYVDATMAHFDISENLSLDIQPAIFQAPGQRAVAAGLNWAFNF